MTFTNENPWMWAVLLVVVGLPLAIFIYLACSSKSTPSPIARAKKTDEYSTDSEHKEEAVISKSNLNSSEDDGVQPNAADAQEANDDYDDKDEKDDDDEEEEENEEQVLNTEENETTEQLQEDTIKTAMEPEGGVKKRKPRRE